MAQSEIASRAARIIPPLRAYGRRGGIYTLEHLRRRDRRDGADEGRDEHGDDCVVLGPARREHANHRRGMSCTPDVVIARNVTIACSRFPCRLSACSSSIA